MTYSQVILLINTFIITNGNNEITAAVLNPILKALADFPKDEMGSLSDLTTSDNATLVAAINSLKNEFDDLVNNGVQLTTGVEDPNDSPPTTYNYSDFYMQLDGDNLPIQLWQYTGFEWTTLSAVYSKAEIDVMFDNVYETIGGNFMMIDYPLVTVAETQDFTLPVGKTALQVFVNGVQYWKTTSNNSSRTDRWTQTGTTVTLIEPTEVNNYIVIFYK